MKKLAKKAKAEAAERSRVYGRAGGKLVASWKKDLEETKCCGLVVLPGVMTRLYLARTINEVIDAEVEKARAGTKPKSPEAISFLVERSTDGSFWGDFSEHKTQGAATRTAKIFAARYRVVFRVVRQSLVHVVDGRKKGASS